MRSERILRSRLRQVSGVVFWAFSCSCVFLRSCAPVGALGFFCVLAWLLPTSAFAQRLFLGACPFIRTMA